MAASQGKRFVADRNKDGEVTTARASARNGVLSPLGFVMPRQPFLPFLLNNRDGQFNVGPQALQQRPEIELLIANCMMAWPPTEAEMAMLLAHLLGAEQSEAALAVFQSLRRSSAQKEAIREAAAVTLSDADQELLNAIIAAHSAIEKQRNALAHGHFGTYSLLTDGVVWMETKSFLDTKIKGELGHQTMTAEFLTEMYSNVSIYKAPDVAAIFEDIKDIADIWNKFIHYLRVHQSLPLSTGLYRQLCERPRIALELAKHRRGNSPPTPLGSPPQAPLAS